MYKRNLDQMLNENVCVIWHIGYLDSFLTN